MDWNLFSYIFRSKERTSILFALVGRKLTPTKIAELTNLHKSNVSRSLKALEEKDLVRCLTPGERIGRLFELTEEGIEIVNEIKKERKALEEPND